MWKYPDNPLPCCDAEIIPMDHPFPPGSVAPTNYLHELYKTPCWSVVNAQGIKNFIPPNGIEHIGIFGDNDNNYAGHWAVYELACKLTLKGIKVAPMFPSHAGTDYLDVWADIQQKQKKIDQISEVPY